MLRGVVAANGAVNEGMREGAWVGDVEEVCNVEGRGGETV